VYSTDTEILFPMRVAPALRGLRGAKWRRLVDRALAAPDGDPRQLAFGLMMIRLAGCLTCHPDSYRALRGCTACACHTVRRHRGEDDDLIAHVQRAQAEVDGYLAEAPLPGATLPHEALTEMREPS
jgi:hypothetical protein